MYRSCIVKIVIFASGKRSSDCFFFAKREQSNRERQRFFCCLRENAVNATQKCVFFFVSQNFQSFMKKNKKKKKISMHIGRRWLGSFFFSVFWLNQFFCTRQMCYSVIFRSQQTNTLWSHCPKKCIIVKRRSARGSIACIETWPWMRKKKNSSNGSEVSNSVDRMFIGRRWISFDWFRCRNGQTKIWKWF